MNTRKLLCSMVALLILMSGSMATCAFALAAGGYAVANTTYYINPDTGVADDGGDTSIGEGMCRNSVYADSFYELKDGRHYLTIRLKLISFISNIAFQVQQVKGDGESYRNVSYTVTGENKEENTRDFRLELPAADALIRPSFFVAPMNRDVTFFMRINQDTARKDDGSFAAFNNSKAGESPEPASNTGGNPKTLPAKPVGGETPANGGTTAAGNEVPAAAPAGGNEQASVTGQGAPGQKTEEVTGIAEFPAGKETGAEDNAAGDNPKESSLLGSGTAAAGTAVIILCLAGGGFWVRKKKRL
ncbi:NEAr transporter [Syntrophobotulus glycolicus DSM 8271]|uniref:NEAr transporter n=1 Tax=Syntrophobotulus glycolicus (strain DSM 8271 / FlGlyR) TaxID=645991 RepID=F0SX03_SYNGF|nr:heme-binding Shp domain-containing protein [Syntrophobotulus glycolicus]ADY55786.1 NEAr transporter [Syntrophobotulus glycolicus DSM 8271]